MSAPTPRAPCPPTAALPAHRAQVVLQRAHVGRIPCARPGAGGAQLLPAPPGAGRRLPQRLPHPASQGQARQPLERVERGRVREHGRPPGRRGGSRGADHHRDGVANPARLHLRHHGGDAPGRRRGRLARPAPRGVRAAARRPARHDGGARRPRARVGGRDRDRPATRARPRRRRRAEVAFRRLATAVAKYWICKRGPEHAYEALECLGGNGYTEAFPLARRYREQPVMAIWEGSGNVIALDVLRALAREPESFEAFDAEVSKASRSLGEFDAHLEATRSLARGRRLATGCRVPPGPPTRRRPRARLQASLLIRTAPAAVSDAFVASRLGPDRGHLYGELPASADLARSSPAPNPSSCGGDAQQPAPRLSPPRRSAPTPGTRRAQSLD